MQVKVQCDDIVVVLSRILDQTRRMGIGIAGISAAQGIVVVTIDDPSDQLSNTLRRRMELIEGITALSIGDALVDLGNSRPRTAAE